MAVRIMIDDSPMSHFASTIVKNKYAKSTGGGNKEDWYGIADRVVDSVVLPYAPTYANRLRDAIKSRKLMPGGRYLYASGLPYHQVNNCLAGETKIITKDGVKRLDELVGQSFQVLNRYGQWEDATAQCFGVQPLLKMTFSNRDVVYATAGHNWCKDREEFSTTLETDRVQLVKHKVQPLLDEQAIRHGICFGDGTTQQNEATDRLQLIGSRKAVLAGYWPQEEVRPYKTGPAIRGIPKLYKKLPKLSSCTPEYARGFIAGLIATDGSTKTSTVTISCNGYKRARAISQLAVLGGCVVSGIHTQPGDTNFGKRSDVSCVIRIKPFSAPLIRPDQIQDLANRNLRPTKMWLDVEKCEETDRVENVYCCVVSGTHSFTLANGVASGNCFLFKVDEDSREGWGRTSYKAINSLMTGGGVGIVYTPVRGGDQEIKGMGGRSTGPCSLAQIINEGARHIIQGGSRRAALWAGLHWWHPDCLKFATIKDWPQWLKDRKEIDFNTAAPMDGTNISIILDTDFFNAINDVHWSKTYRQGNNNFTVTHKDAVTRYWACVEHMLITGEPGFSVDTGINEGCNLRNACTEVTSATNDDMCNLASLNLARIYSLQEFNELTELGIIFLLCGTLYSKLPIPEMYKVREQNRRLGLGLMGVHEWLLRRERRYGPDQELGEWLDCYAKSGVYANLHADIMGISRPVATRSIAPTGTISIAAETTGGIEPIFAAAYLRRYLKGTKWHAQHVLDATAKRLVDDGVNPDLIEDSYTLAEDIDRRIHFQTWVQGHVDHGISSTLNLPKWGSSTNNESTVKAFGEKLLKYLPKLRGITVYPDGARGGQPLTRLTYSEAIKRGVGYEFVEQSEENIPEGAYCKSGVCGE